MLFWYVPLTQGMHAAAEVAPCMDWKVPLAQGLHAPSKVAAVLFWYLPLPQVEQELPPVPD